MMAVCLLSSMKVEAKVISEEITNLSKTDSINFATDDADKNVRYIGVQPKNYVNFNNELWRIVGVFNGHVKLIRVEALGRYSYDSSESAINGGLGVNYWGDSDLMYELNGDYLNYNLTENAKWYDNQNNSKKGNFDYTKVIGKEAQELIEESTWYLGSPNVVDGELSSEKELFTASSLYYYERNGKNDTIEPGTSNSNDNVERKTTLKVKIGLLYTSDYLY